MAAMLATWKNKYIAMIMVSPTVHSVADLWNLAVVAHLMISILSISIHQLNVACATNILHSVTFVLDIYVMFGKDRGYYEYSWGLGWVLLSCLSQE